MLVFKLLMDAQQLAAPVLSSKSTVPDVREHDICKIRIAVLLLTCTRPDTDFPKLANLLAECKVATMIKAYGISRHLGQQMMHHTVKEEVRKPAIQ